jgi:hypothetical protein
MSIELNISMANNGIILKHAARADQYKQLQYTHLRQLAVIHLQHPQALTEFGLW